MSYQAGQTLTAASISRLMAYTQPSASDTFTTATKVLTADQVTFNAISGHTYAVSFSTHHSSSGTSAATLSARYIAGNGPVATGSAIIWQRVFQSGAGIDTFYARRLITGISGVITVGLTGLTNTATVTLYGGSIDRELLVEDMGP